MTEEADKVTTEKPKNPGRQEWGRKLGKMQKELKLKKQEKDEKVENPQVSRRACLNGNTLYQFLQSE